MRLLAFVLACVAAPSMGFAADAKKALNSSTKLEFVDTPLSEAVRFVAQLHAINVKLDKKVVKDTPVTLVFKGKLSKGLEKLLKPLKLKYRVVKGELLIEPAVKKK